MHQPRSRQQKDRPSAVELELDAVRHNYPDAPVERVDPDPVSWLEANRHLKNKPYTLSDGREYFRDIARDQSPVVNLAKSRQIGFTTLAVGLLLHFATLHRSTNSIYVTANMLRAKFFAKNQMGTRTLKASPKLAALMDESEDLVQTKQLKNGSWIILASGQRDFDAVQGMDIDYMIIDECQSQNMLALPTAAEALSESKYGRLLCAGVGQTQGGSWERTFHQGQEYRWNHKKKKWSRLKGQSGDPDIHSYYLPRSSIGRYTPRQIEQAVGKYLSRSLGLQHVEAAWTSGGDKPFPRHVMDACVMPHPVDPGDAPQYLGIDYGGGALPNRTCPAARIRRRHVCRRRENHRDLERRRPSPRNNPVHRIPEPPPHRMRHRGRDAPGADPRGQIRLKNDEGAPHGEPHESLRLPAP